MVEILEKSVNEIYERWLNEIMKNGNGTFQEPMTRDEFVKCHAYIRLDIEKARDRATKALAFGAINLVMNIGIVVVITLMLVQK